MAREQTAARPAAEDEATPGARMVTILLIGALALPVYYFLGPLRLTPYRTLLLIWLPVVLMRMGKGKHGSFTLIDWLMAVYGLWIPLALVLNNGISGGLTTGGMIAIDTVIPYFLARVYIRTKRDFLTFVRVAGTIVLILLPLAVYESLTNQRPVSMILQNVMAVYRPVNYEPRLGLIRAQTTFEHPILFGVFASSVFSLAYLCLRAGNPAQKPDRKLALGAIGSTFFSLSSGAFAALAIQFALIAWDRIFRSTARRWQILAALFAVFYVTVDMLSNRSPINVLVTMITFNPATAFNRIMTFEFGSVEVLRNPIFGIGLNDWERPIWMSPSVDNHWLVTAMKYGLPAFLALAFVMLLSMTRARGKGPRDEADPLRWIRKGYIFSLAGIAISIATVAIWNSSYVYVMFLLGAGDWMMRATPAPAAAPAAEAPETVRSRRRHRRALAGPDPTAPVAGPRAQPATGRIRTGSARPSGPSSSVDRGPVRPVRPTRPTRPDDTR